VWVEKQISPLRCAPVDMTRPEVGSSGSCWWAWIAGRTLGAEWVRGLRSSGEPRCGSMPWCLARDSRRAAKVWRRIGRSWDCAGEKMSDSNAGPASETLVEGAVSVEKQIPPLRGCTASVGMAVWVDGWAVWFAICCFAAWYWAASCWA